MHRYLSGLGVLLAGSLLASLAFGYSVPIGATRDEVIQAYGYPASQAKTGERELLNYKEGTVVLDGGRVIEFRFTGVEPGQARRRNTQVPLTPAYMQPQPARPQYIAPATPRPVPSAPVTQPVRPPVNSGIKIWFWFVPLVVLIGLLKVLQYGARSKRKPAQRRDQPATTGPDQQTAPPTNAVASQPAAPVTRLTREALSRLEWRRFEELIHGYFESQGWNAQRSRVGADGGIDIFLYRPGQQRPGACVQCKAWNTYMVGVKPVRELLGVMAANQISEGYFVTTNEYTSEAKAFANGNTLHLLCGANILSRFAALSDSDHQRIVGHAFRGDYETPTCPSCDEKMVPRESDTPFWGCRNYPRCRRTFKMRDA